MLSWVMFEVVLGDVLMLSWVMFDVVLSDV